MSSYNTIAEKDSEASTDDQAVAEADPELRATVELETQAKVDTNHPDVDTASMTLEAEETFRARKAEKARTRRRFDRRESSDREARTRQAAERGSRERRQAFQRRAASVDSWADPERDDPHSELTQEELAAVNEQAEDIAETVREAGSRAAVSRQLAERVATGASVLSASVAVMERARTAPGTVVPIGALEALGRSEVAVEGEIAELWPTRHPAIAQVGLIADETGQTKFTAWKRSRCRPVREGDRVRFRAAALNWHQGRVSIALTGDTHVTLLERA